MAVTRIKNNQITDAAITSTKIASGTLVGSLFNPELTLNSNVTINGNLSVLGGTSTISSTNTFVNDPLVVFNNGYVGAPTYDVGILINRNLNPINTALVWNEAEQAFLTVFTTESGGTSGTINKTGFAGIKGGDITADGTVTAGGGTVKVSANKIEALSGDLTVAAAGGDIMTSGRVVPVNVGDTIGTAAAPFAAVFTPNVVLATGSTITAAGASINITPAAGGTVNITDINVTGTSTFTGNIVSANATITGGAISNTSISGSTGSFTSITDTGALTANGLNAAISLAPTGTGTVTIAPSTTGSISNMSGSFTTLASSGTTTLGATSASSVTTAAATITGGAISNTSISGSTGSFTSITDTGALTANGLDAAISLAPTGTGTVTINPATAGTIANMAISGAAGSFTTLTSSGAASFASIDNTPIGQGGAAAGTFTTLGGTTATITNGTVTNLTTGNAQVTGGAISGTPITNSTISGSTGSFTTLTVSAGATLSPATGTVAINPTTTGAMDNMIIGANNPAAGTFDALVASSLSVPAITDTPVSGSTGSFTTLSASTSANFTTSGTVTINPTVAGTIANMAISGAAGSFTTMTTADAQVTGGAIIGTPVSGSTGSFTTLSASASATLSPTGAVTIFPTTTGTMDNMSIGATSPAAGTFTTMATPSAAISGGIVNGTSVGATVPSTGAFTTLSANGGITGTLATAAQPNVTSVGTLSSLAVTGAATVGGNDVLTDATVFVGDVIGTSGATALSTVGTAGTYTSVTTDAKGRVTAGTNPTTLAGYGITDAAPLSHVTDDTVHLTSAQNIWIDNITASSTEVNRLVGVTSDVQTQLDAKLNLAGGTLTGDVTVAATKFINLTSLPETSLHAVNKSYVDSLVTSSTTWRAPITSPTLADILAAAPGVAPTVRSTFIATATATWGTLSVVSGDIVEWNGSDYVLIGTLSVDDRFIVAGEGGSIGATLLGTDARKVDLVQYAGGDPTLAASWTRPEADNNQAVELSVNKVAADPTGLANDATVYTAVIRVNATPNPVSIIGSDAQSYTTLLSQINADLTGATATIVAGHIHITGTLSTDRILITDTDLFSSLTGFVDIRGSAKPGTTVLCNNTLSGDLGHTYLFSGGDDGDHAWTEIGGPGSISAGIGLEYVGSVLNVKLGAGVAELPSDEVGIDLYSASGLLLTSNGTADDLTSSGKLAVKLDGATLARSAAGIKVATGGITAVELAVTGVTAGAYGDTTNVSTFTVDEDGRLTAAGVAAIAFPVTSVATKTGAVTLVQADIGGLTTTDSPTFAGVTTANAVLTGGTANNVVIGGGTAAAGTFTTLTAASLTVPAINNTVIGNVTPSTGKFTTLESTGLATLASAGVTGALTAGSVTTVSATITGGTVNGTVIGGVSPLAGSFTDLTATTSVSMSPSGTVTINPTTTGSIANMTGSFTTLAASGATTLAGMTSTGITASPISGSTGSFTTLAASGLTTMTDATASTSTTSGAVVVTGGVGISGAVHIGGATTMAAASATSLTTTGALTANGLDAAISLAPTGLGTVTINPSTVGAITNMTIAGQSGSFSTMTTAAADITGGTINGTSVGATAASSGAFTTLSASHGVTLSPTVGTVTVAPTNVGSITNVNIGATNPGTGAFTNLSVGSLTLAAINGTVIGNVTPSTGAFTTLSATSGITGSLTTAAQTAITSVGTLTGLTVSGTSTLAGTTATTLSASGDFTANGSNATISLAPTGTGTVVINPNSLGFMTNVEIGSALLRSDAYFDDVNANTGTFNTSLGTATLSTSGLATLASASVTAGLTAGSVTTASAAISGGTINGTSIGAGGAASGAFTTLAASGASTLTGAVTIESTIASTSTTTGALKVAGGVGIGGNVHIGTGATINATNSAVDTIIKGGIDNSLVFVSSTTDQVMVGGAVTSNAGFTAGVKFHVNSTDSMMAPVGTLGQRPATPVSGMMRYNTTYNTLEFFNGAAWQSTATVFTVVSDQQFNGDGTTTVFTLSAPATTAGTIISINGVVQAPTSAYSISSTTLTFTTAPSIGDVVDARALTTTTEMVGLASSNGQCAVSADNAGLHFSTGTSSSTERVFIDTTGHVHLKAGAVGTYNQTADVVGTSPTVIASFDKTAYRTGKFIVQVKNSGGTEFESTEVLVLHDGTTAYSAEYAGMYTGSLPLGEITVAVNGANVELSYTGAASGNTVKVKQDLIAV